MKRLLWLCVLFCLPVWGEAVLHIYSGQALLPDELIGRFEQQCQCVVAQDIYQDADQMRVVMGEDRSLSLVITPDYMVAELIRDKRLLKLDKSQLGNSANLSPSLNRSAYDPGNQYSMPMSLALLVVGYNIDKLKALKVDPYSWSVIFDPKILARLAGHVGVQDNTRAIFTAALLYLGRDPAKATDDDYNRAHEVIAAARPYWALLPDHYGRSLVTGDVWVALGYSPRLYQAREMASQQHRAYTIGYVPQREGNVTEASVMVIPAVAPHPELALRFMNFMLDGKQAAVLSNLNGSTTPVQTATLWLEDDLKFHPVINPDVTALQKWPLLREIPDKTLHKLKGEWHGLRDQHPVSSAPQAVLPPSPSRSGSRK